MITRSERQCNVLQWSSVDDMIDAVIVLLNCHNGSSGQKELLLGFGNVCEE